MLFKGFSATLGSSWGIQKSCSAFGHGWTWLSLTEANSGTWSTDCVCRCYVASFPSKENILSLWIYFNSPLYSVFFVLHRYVCILYDSLMTATKTLVYPFIAWLRKYMLRAVLMGLLPSRQTISWGSVLLLILLRILILQYGIESMTITFHDDRKSEGTDNN